MSLVLNVEILGEYKKLTQATKGATKQLQGIGKTTTKISNLMSGALGAIGVGFSLNAVVQGIKSVTTAASDLGEATNAINVAFGDSAREIERFGKQAAQAVGLSKTELFGIATQFSSFAKTVAGEGGNAAKVVQQIATRGADFASVFNLDVSDALSKFQSGLAGQSEPLRAFGIDLSAASVEAFAVANGIVKAGETMTETEKVMARYGLLMEQTAMTQGDFQNTSDGLANTQRILKAEFENVKAEVGAALLPVMTELFQTIRDNLPQIKTLISEVIRFIPPLIESALKLFEFRQQLIPVITAVSTLSLGLKAYTTVAGIAATGTGALATAMSAALAPITAVIAALTAFELINKRIRDEGGLDVVQPGSPASNFIPAPGTPINPNPGSFTNMAPGVAPKPTAATPGKTVTAPTLSKPTPLKSSPSPSSPVVINNNINVKKSIASGPDIAKAINAANRNVGSQTIKVVPR